MFRAADVFALASFKAVSNSSILIEKENIDRTTKCLLESGLKKGVEEELSEHCGCTPTHIYNLENGKIGVSLELLFRISVYLDKSMDYFVMDNENANPQIKIENNIAPKLKQCDTHMLEMVCTFIDGLITYKEQISSSFKNGE